MKYGLLQGQLQALDVQHDLDVATSCRLPSKFPNLRLCASILQNIVSFTEFHSNLYSSKQKRTR